MREREGENHFLYFCRSTPCPHVKQSDEWIDPTVCEAGDSCKYCHTRTEQQFHPEVCFDHLTKNSVNGSFVLQIRFINQRNAMMFLLLVIVPVDLSVRLLILNVRCIE